MVDVLKPMNVGDALGIRGKSLTLGLNMTYFSTYMNAKNAIRERANVEQEYRRLKEEVKKHSIENIEKSQKGIDEAAINVVKAMTKLFIYDALILKTDFGTLKKIGFLLQDIKRAIGKKSKEYREIEKLEKGVFSNLELGEHNLKIELKYISCL